MNRRWGVALAGAILLTAPTWGQIDAGGGYHGPALGHAGDVTYPMNSSTTGIVTLDISVDATGTVQNVGVVRDVPPLTSAAQSAVRSWQFTPAIVNGLATAGTVRVNVVFNPFNPSGVGLPSPPLQPANSNEGAKRGDFQPAQVTEAHYATYPPTYGAGGDGGAAGARGERGTSAGGYCGARNRITERNGVESGEDLEIYGGEL